MESSSIWREGVSFILNYWITAHEVEYRRYKGDLVEGNEASYARSEFERVEGHGDVKMLFTGSRIEGMSCAYFERAKKHGPNTDQSDQDIMVLDEGNIVDESHSVPTITDQVDPSLTDKMVELFSTMTPSGAYGLQSVFDRSSKHLHPGFCTLRNKVTNDVIPSKGYHIEALIKERGGLIPSSMSVHGPALSRMDHPLRAMDVDILTCVRISHWPLEAADWITRHRPSGWPDWSMITAIVRGGCHIVPVGHPSSLTLESEWRLSFSKAEIILSHSITREQRQVYLVFKTICKYAVFVNTTGNTQVKLASYFLKTLLFWEIESGSTLEWNRNQNADVLMRLLDRLLSCLQEHNLQNYFIPENNMIDQISERDVGLLAERLYAVKEDLLGTIITIDKNIGILGKTVIPLSIIQLERPVINWMKSDVSTHEEMIRAKLHSLARMTMYWYIMAPRPPGVKLSDLTGEPGMQLLHKHATFRVTGHMTDLILARSGQGQPREFWERFVTYVEETLYNETILNAVSIHSVNMIPFDAIMFILCAGQITKSDVDEVMDMFKAKVYK